MTCSFTNSIDYETRVALGTITGQSKMNGIGERESMGTTPGGEDIWRGNELTPAPTSHVKIPTPDPAGEQMSVVGESADDTAGGSGARSVMVHYIDVNGTDRQTAVIMNGLTPVNLSVADIIFINDFHVMTAGPGLVTAGHIKIYKTSDAGLVYNMIAIGGNKSLVPHRMVPAGHTLVVKNWHAEEAQVKRCNFRIRSTDMHNELMSGVFLFKDSVYLKGTTSGNLPLNVAIPAMSVIKVTGWPDAVGAEGSCGWNGILIRN
jgi:hypothetical protein